MTETAKTNLKDALAMLDTVVSILDERGNEDPMLGLVLSTRARIDTAIAFG